MQALREEILAEPCQEDARSNRTRKLALLPYQTPLQVTIEQRALLTSYSALYRRAGENGFLPDVGSCVAQ
ncbi:hypothetical protein [Candidatus Methylacidithermus pantelleriae]|uniref:hypothetical protein n=1 Tax=Candidatus Methylacidithermus pantelleriae TaxID=2744239 RepID=UPI00157D4797|nr:hypothetical protein [Candidatus Methylacidithermus pantelleriae]